MDNEGNEAEFLLRFRNNKAIKARAEELATEVTDKLLGLNETEEQRSKARDDIVRRINQLVRLAQDDGYIVEGIESLHIKLEE